MKPEQFSGEERICVLVADSSRFHTQLLADVLKREPRFEVIASASDSQSVAASAGGHKIDVAVLSSTLDGEPLRGFEVLRELRALQPQLRGVMLLDCSKRETILAAFQAGAKGIFSRNESVETLSKCVMCVHSGEIWANSQQMGYAAEALASAPKVKAVDANGFDLLSKRELEVVRSLAEGLTNREIAEKLNLSQHTIKNYLFRIFDKLGVSSRIELLFMTLSQAGAAPADRDLASSSDTPEYADPTGCKNAAARGLPGAQVALAELYGQGEVVPRDPVAAYMWYLIAENTCLSLRESASVSRRSLASTMTAEQVLEAQRMAAEHMKKPSGRASQDRQARSMAHAMV